MKSIIIGRGEIGTSLFRVLANHYLVGWVDLEAKHLSFSEGQGPEIMHICFGYSDLFVDEVKRYQEQFKPLYTVIHSTVPVGTSTKLNAIHSPMRGLHPNLESGIRTFPKFIGGPKASEVADYFRRADLKVVLYDKSETTEALKLFDTEYYRHCIDFALEVKEFCDKHHLNFSEVYTIPNQTYNEGYTKLGHPEFVRPVLQPIQKEIGGHCVLPNQKLLEKSND